MTRLFGALGACAGLGGLALGAYASHAAALDAEDARRLLIAAATLLAHGILLVQMALLSRAYAGLLLPLAGIAVSAGTLLFAGSLVARSLLGWPAVLAPWGGVLQMLGWLLLAVVFVGAHERVQR